MLHFLFDHRPNFLISPFALLFCSFLQSAHCTNISLKCILSSSASPVSLFHFSLYLFLSLSLSLFISFSLFLLFLTLFFDFNFPISISSLFLFSQNYCSCYYFYISFYEKRLSCFYSRYSTEVLIALMTS